jgi:HAD superfamily hydrolase (TIGR01509 family)
VQALGCRYRDGSRTQARCHLWERSTWLILTVNMADPHRGTPLTAVIFDVDGTLVDSERHGHRVAFNRAFAELGLPDRWSEKDYGRLLAAVTGGQRRLHHHLAARGMPDAERATLVPRLHVRKTELFSELVRDGEVPARPGAALLVDHLLDAGVPLAVATVGSRVWVAPLLDRLFGADRFAAVVCGDEVDEPKPAPACYLAALRRLGRDPRGTVAVEDSRMGLLSASAAGLRCVVVANPYTLGQDLTEADLVLDGFGEPGAPVHVLHDPHGLRPPRGLDPETLARVAALPGSPSLGRQIDHE